MGRCEAGEAQECKMCKNNTGGPQFSPLNFNWEHGATVYSQFHITLLQHLCGVRWGIGCWVAGWPIAQRVGRPGCEL